jgi:hypothetical protein
MLINGPAQFRRLVNRSFPKTRRHGAVLGRPNGTAFMFRMSPLRWTAAPDMRRL